MVYKEKTWTKCRQHVIDKLKEEAESNSTIRFYNLRSFKQMFQRYSLLDIIRTCTKVTYKILQSNSCVATNYKFTFLAAHIRDKDCTNYQHTVYVVIFEWLNLRK